jgi:hypothetical protein
MGAAAIEAHGAIKWLGRFASRARLEKRRAAMNAGAVASSNL